MILSVSSSIASSKVLISLDTSGTLFSCVWILSSFSKSLIAKKRFWSSGTSPNLAATALMASSTFASNLCTSFTAFFCSARLTAFSAAFSMPVPFSAEISTTSQPKLALSFEILILSPVFSTTSIMLIAISTGIPSSNSCVLRYRFLSRLVPSMIFRMASGLSLIR